MVVVQTHVQSRVIIVRVMQTQRSFLQLLPLVGERMFGLVELEALPGESAAAPDALALLREQQHT